MNLGELKKSELTQDSQNKRKESFNSKSLNININLDTPQKRSRHSSGEIRKVQTKTVKPKTKGRFNFIKSHKIFSAFLILLVLLGSFYGAKILELRKTGLNIGVLDPIKSAISAVSAPNETAISGLNKTNGKTNFVVLGVDARKGNESYLTDSIMLLSYDHETNKMAQISFPRDLEAKYIINDRSYDTKINSVFPNTMAETKSLDQGFKNLGKAIEDISGMPIHYGMMINFGGFKEIIDTLGGISVDVENSFSDYTYPNDNDTGVISVSFKKGVQTLNGTKALQYSRSRHSLDSGEGSDFMRARRQQKVMIAIKDKFISSGLFNKADSINQIVSTLGNNIKFYNINGDNINTAIQSRDLLKDVKTFSMVIDPTFGSFTNQLLISSDKGGSLGSAVTPTDSKTGYSEVKDLIQFYIANSFLLEEKAVPRVVWTNPKRYNDYVKFKQEFWDLNLKFEFNDNLVRVADAAGSTQIAIPSTSPTESPRTTGTIYVLGTNKDKSVEFYKKKFSEDKIDLNVKPGTELPKELERLRDGTDIMIVVD